MPMSDFGLIFASHYLGLVHLYVFFTLLMQFVQQEELAQGIPFIIGILSFLASLPFMLSTDFDSILLNILSAISPFVGMVQYHVIYITYDSIGYNTGIHSGENVISSGLLGNMIAQVVGILIGITLIIMYTSPVFDDWITRLSSFKNTLKNPTSEDRSDDGDLDVEDSTATANFEALAPGAKIMMSIRGLVHTYYPNCCGKAKPVEVLKGFDMDIVKGEVFGYLGHNGAGSKCCIEITCIIVSAFLIMILPLYDRNYIC
jgi:hypothetical protein